MLTTTKLASEREKLTTSHRHQIRNTNVYENEHALTDNGIFCYVQSEKKIQSAYADTYRPNPQNNHFIFRVSRLKPCLPFQK